MEQREPAGAIPIESEHPGELRDAPSRRFPRLMPPPSARRAISGRWLLTALGTVLAVTAILLAAGFLLRRSIDWLQVQPAYQLAFEDIILEPPPPRWLRGGPAEFLVRVARESGVRSRFSSLEIDVEKLRDAFKRDGCVEKVSSVEIGHPNRVVVRLEYRKPLAYAQFEDGREIMFVDRDGVIVPNDRLDREAAGPLVRLYGFDRPANPLPGKDWERLDPKSGFARRDDRVRAAARLAGVFIANGSLQTTPTIDPSLVTIQPWGRRASYVQYSGLMLLWESDDTGQSITSDAKWMMFNKWVRDNATSGKDVVYLVFTPNGVALDPHRNDPKRSRPLRSE